MAGKSHEHRLSRDDLDGHKCRYLVAERLRFGVAVIRPLHTSLLGPKGGTDASPAGITQPISDQSADAALAVAAIRSASNTHTAFHGKPPLTMERIHRLRLPRAVGVDAVCAHT